MQALTLGRERDVTEFGSRGAHWVAVAASEGECHIGRMRFDPGAVLGMHPTRVDQIMLVIEGSGWTQVEGGDPTPIAAGQAVVWRAGEEHESGTDEGMTALIIQAETLLV